MSGLGRLVFDQRAEPSAIVVFLHGFGGEAAQWKPLFKAMPDVGARLIAYDLPGHAGSLGFPDAGPPKVAAMAVIA